MNAVSLTDHRSYVLLSNPLGQMSEFLSPFRVRCSCRPERMALFLTGFRRRTFSLTFVLFIESVSTESKKVRSETGSNIWVQQKRRNCVTFRTKCDPPFGSGKANSLLSQNSTWVQIFCGCSDHTGSKSVKAQSFRIYFLSTRNVGTTERQMLLALNANVLILSVSRCAIWSCLACTPCLIFCGCALKREREQKINLPNLEPKPNWSGRTTLAFHFWLQSPSKPWEVYRKTNLNNRPLLVLVA